jgi:putative ABC transport system substrate-binding protein
MRRREFIVTVGGVAAAWPIAARAQQPGLPVVGFLNQGAAKSDANFAVEFRNGLKQVGYVEGQNVLIEYRWAEGRYNQLPELTAELVHRNVSVIAAAYAEATHVAMAATSIIPIVFLTGTDPIQSGLVRSFNKPGGNVTGISIFNVLIGAKRLGLLHDLLPAVSTFGVLVNPTNPLVSEPFLKSMQSAASALGLQIVVLPASNDHEIDNSFVKMVEQRIAALLVATDSFFTSRRSYLVTLSARHAIPAIYDRRETVAAGGLMGYGTDFADGFVQQGIYVGRILKGEKPADLPVLQATKFEFVINLGTAKALGLTIPPGLLAIADEVIE